MDIEFAELVEEYSIDKDPILGYEIVQTLVEQGEEDFHKIMADYDIPDIMVWDAICDYSPGWTGEILEEIMQEILNRPNWEFLEYSDFSLCNRAIIIHEEDLLRPLKYRGSFRGVWKISLDDIPNAVLDLFYSDEPRYHDYPALSLVSVPVGDTGSIRTPTVRMGIRSIRDVEPALDALEEIAYLAYKEEMFQDPREIFYVD